MSIPSTHEIKALFQELGNGSEPALNRIYRIYSSSMMYCSLQLLADRGLAEEVVMDSFQTLWENRKAVSLMNNPAGWLFKCVHNKSLNELQRNKKRSTIPVLEESDLYASGQGYAEMETKEFFLLVDREIEKLPPRQKEIFRLKKISGLSRKEIAHLYKLSESTVKKHINNALRHLQKAIKSLSG